MAAHTFTHWHSVLQWMAGNVCIEALWLWPHVCFNPALAEDWDRKQSGLQHVIMPTDQTHNQKCNPKQRH
jgi:hypothetical protein